MRSLTTLVMLVGLATPTLAQTTPTESDQRRACSGDAMHLCFRFFRDRPQMRSCMIANYDQLGSACRAVFDATTRAEAAGKVPAH